MTPGELSSFAELEDVNEGDERDDSDEVTVEGKGEEHETCQSRSIANVLHE